MRKDLFLQWVSLPCADDAHKPVAYTIYKYITIISINIIQKVTKKPWNKKGLEGKLPVINFSFMFYFFVCLFHDFSATSIYHLKISSVSSIGF